MKNHFWFIRHLNNRFCLKVILHSNKGDAISILTNDQVVDTTPRLNNFTETHRTCFDSFFPSHGSKRISSSRYLDPDVVRTLSYFFWHLYRLETTWSPYRSENQYHFFDLAMMPWRQIRWWHLNINRLNSCVFCAIFAREIKFVHTLTFGHGNGNVSDTTKSYVIKTKRLTIRPFSPMWTGSSYSVVYFWMIYTMTSAVKRRSALNCGSQRKFKLYKPAKITSLRNKH